MEVLKTMENNKSHGNEEIPAEFYKSRGLTFQSFMLKQSTMRKLGKLPISQRKGIIKLIPKKNTVPYNLSDQSLS